VKKIVTLLIILCLCAEGCSSREAAKRRAVQKRYAVSVEKMRDAVREVLKSPLLIEETSIAMDATYLSPSPIKEAQSTDEKPFEWSASSVTVAAVGTVVSLAVLIWFLDYIGIQRFFNFTGDPNNKGSDNYNFDDRTGEFMRQTFVTRYFRYNFFVELDSVSELETEARFRAEAEVIDDGKSIYREPLKNSVFEQVFYTRLQENLNGYGDQTKN
jgi:hypothetical protein